MDSGSEDAGNRISTHVWAVAIFDCILDSLQMRAQSGVWHLMGKNNLDSAPHTFITNSWAEKVLELSLIKPQSPSEHTIQAYFHCWSRRYWESWRTKAIFWFWWKPRKTDLRGKVGHNEGREQVPTGATFSKYHCESPSSTYFSIVALFDCWNSLPPS